MRIAACDECRDTNAKKWIKIGVLKLENATQLTLGVVPEKEMPGYEVHDICGDHCFHKHIDRLLGRLVELAPPPLPAMFDVWVCPNCRETVSSRVGPLTEHEFRSSHMCKSYVDPTNPMPEGHNSI